MPQPTFIFGLALASCLLPAVQADVVFLSQQRTVTLTTSADGRVQVLSAADFSAFIRSLTQVTTFAGAGGSAVNSAGGRIDCQIDPNSVRARGAISGAGGLPESPGAAVEGDSIVSVDVTFMITTPTQFRLTSVPRPNLDPSDHFNLALREVNDRTLRIINIDEFDPPQQVDLSGILVPGTYSLRYRVQGSFPSEPTARDFAFNLALGCQADFNGVGGVSFQDLLDWLTAWFADNQRADFTGDGTVSVQDLFSFLDAWFRACA